MPAIRVSKKNARKEVAVPSKEKGQRKRNATPTTEEDGSRDHSDAPAKKATKQTLEARNRALEDELARMKGE
jgi:hypothetical protein